ncbi:MAG: metallophosphoesterase [Nitrososphaerota archaeon]
MSNTRLRIFYASDIHGSDLCFKKFINAVDTYKCDVIMLGGDITGKYIVPIFNRGNYYEFKLGNENYSISSRDELEKYIYRIKASGSYPFITSKEEWQNLISEKEKMDEIFNNIVIESIKEWIEFAERKLAGKNVKCLVMPGNDDSYAIDPILDASAIVINPNEKVIDLADRLEVISLGYSNVTPWMCPRDIPEEEIESKMASLVSKVDADAEVIYNIHVPPFDSGIDYAPELDDNMRPKVGPGGQLLMAPVGSRAVRKYIESYQPLLGLHGHVHEGRGFSRIGRTLCFNPGSEYHDGILRGVLIQLDKNKVKDYIFTAG